LGEAGGVPASCLHRRRGRAGARRWGGTRQQRRGDGRQPAGGRRRGVGAGAGGPWLPGAVCGQSRCTCRAASTAMRRSAAPP